MNEVGCSMNDLVADEGTWPDRGRFLQHLESVLNDFRSEGLLDGREIGAITSAAARATIGG